MTMLVAKKLPKADFDADGRVILTEEFIRAAIESAPTLEEFDAETKRRMALSREEVLAAHRKKTWGDVIDAILGRKRAFEPR